MIFYNGLDSGSGVGITYSKNGYTVIDWTVSEDGTSLAIEADGVTITHPLSFDEYNDILEYNDVWFNRVYTSTRY